MKLRQMQALETGDEAGHGAVVYNREGHPFGTIIGFHDAWDDWTKTQRMWVWIERGRVSPITLERKDVYVAVKGDAA